MYLFTVLTAREDVPSAEHFLALFRSSQLDIGPSVEIDTLPTAGLQISDFPCAVSAVVDRSTGDIYLPEGMALRRCCNLLDNQGFGLDLSMPYDASSTEVLRVRIQSPHRAGVSTVKAMREALPGLSIKGAIRFYHGEPSLLTRPQMVDVLVESLMRSARRRADIMAQTAKPETAFGVRDMIERFCAA